MNHLGSFSDCDLIKLLKQGDEAAFNEIYNRYWLKLYNDSYKRLKDEALSADVIQDVFADMWIKRESKNIENLGAYLHSAARYHVFYFIKKTNTLPLLKNRLKRWQLTPAR